MQLDNQDLVNFTGMDYHRLPANWGPSSLRQLHTRFQAKLRAEATTQQTTRVDQRKHQVELLHLKFVL